jgi:hypothetical protein
VPLPKIPLDDPRVLALAKARQQFAHDCTYLPTREELTDKEREGALPDARNYLESAINAGLVPAVELIDSGWRASLTNINDEIERQTTAMATAAADLPAPALRGSYVDERGRQPGQVRRPRRRRVGGDVVGAPGVAEQGRPSTLVGRLVPDAQPGQLAR